MRKIESAMGVRVLLCAIACIGVVLLNNADSAADVGDLIHTIDLPPQHRGISVAIDCDGNLYYTNTDFNQVERSWEAKLYKIRISDSHFYPSVNLVDDLVRPLTVDCLDWNEGGQFLWAMGSLSGYPFGTNSWYRPILYRLDPATGHADVHMVVDDG
jgi:hypothetical protein